VNAQAIDQDSTGGSAGDGAWIGAAAGAALGKIIGAKACADRASKFGSSYPVVCGWNHYAYKLALAMPPSSPSRDRLPDAALPGH
jgi:hypothetical protein